MTDPPEPTDSELAERAIHGDGQALARLLSRHDWFRAYVRRKVRRPDDAEDVIADIHAALVTHIISLRDPLCFRSWLLSITANMIAEYYAKQARLRSYEQPMSDCTDLSTAEDMVSLPSPETSLIEWSDTASRHWKLIEIVKRVCGRRQGRVVLLRLQGVPYGVIATLEGLSRSHARKLYERGRERLVAGIVLDAPELLGGWDEIERAIGRAAMAESPCALSATELGMLQRAAEIALAPRGPDGAPMSSELRRLRKKLIRSKCFRGACLKLRWHV